MTNDLVVRARQALGPAAPRDLQPAKPVDAAAELLARARTAIAAPPKQVLVAAPPPAPPAERVRLPMTCSARGGSYVVIAERRGDELRFVGHEPLQPGPGGAQRLPARLSGTYNIDMKGWTCPLCHSAETVWFCGCAAMNGAMHCVGTSGGRHHCACGRFEERHFAPAEKFEVRGASVAATPGKLRPGPQHGQPQPKQVSYERTR